MSKENATPPDVRLGYVGLSALVFGMMVGAGIFNIPQNMAVAAGPQAVILAWVVTAAGMLTLVATFKILADRHPELNAGMYLYARQGFGMLPGFLTAWGYWLCTAFANVAYAVMLNDTLGALCPALLRHGWPTVAFGSALIWIIYFIVAAGMRTARILNTALSAVKFGCIALIVILLAVHFRFDTFQASFGTEASSGAAALPGLGSQVRDTMLVTLWCFIGIEGAVMMSGRARRNRDVGRAGATGFFTAWILYVLVSVLCFGVMSRARLAGLHDPSVAYVLRECCGPWAYWLVIASVVLSLGGGWVAWSLVCAEVPYTASRSGLLPRMFRRLNRHGIPTAGLFVSSVIMELFLLLVVWAEHVYLTALSITGMMILPAYLLSGLYLWKISRGGRHRAGAWTGAACTLFCAWMIYAGGLDLFFETSLFYVLGLGLYFRTLREHDARSRLSLPPGVRSLVPLGRGDIVGIGVLLLAAAISLCLLAA